MPAHAQGPINGKDAALSKVESRLAALCTPPDSEEGDEIKKNQLRQLAMLNGTYNDKQNGKPNRPRPQGAQAMQGMQGMQGMQAMQGMQGMQARPAQAFQNPYAGYLVVERRLSAYVFAPIHDVDVAM